MAVRQAYSKEDDDAMWRYLHRQVMIGNEDAFAPMGYRIWKSASKDRVTNKSVQSMTCHFRRKLLPAIRKAPLAREDLEFMLSRWSFADQIKLGNIDEDVAIEESDGSNSSGDDIVENVAAASPASGTDQGPRRKPVGGRRKRLVISPDIAAAAAAADLAPGQQSPQATTSGRPPAKSLTLADALRSPASCTTVRPNNRPTKNKYWPLADMEELQYGKKSLVEMKDADAAFSAYEYAEPESAEFQTKLMALVRQGAIPAEEVETVAKVQTSYMIDLAKEFNISLRVILGMVIANDEFRDSKKLREAFMAKKERACQVKTENRPMQTAETM